MKNSFDERENVVSATECTGLIPATPADSAQDESLTRLYAVHAAKKGKDSCGKGRAKKRR